MLSVNGITISANTTTNGTITAQCVPSEDRQVAETLTVFRPNTGSGRRPHSAPYHRYGNRSHYRDWHRHEGPARHPRDDR